MALIAMTIAEKAWIDSASYEGMLRKRRFAPAGDPMFRRDREASKYFERVFAEKLIVVGPDGHTAASKKIGW